MDFNIFHNAFITLFLVVNPFGILPIATNLLGNYSFKQQFKIILKEGIIAYLIFFLFFIFGKNILITLGISDHAFSITGGIILFLIAIRMIFPFKIQINDDEKEEDKPFIVPIATPLIAGPSAISIVVLLSSQYNTSPSAFAGISLAWFVCISILSIMKVWFIIMGKRLIRASERLFGMILLLLSINIIFSGIKLYFF